jgi:hypothetical protein
MGEGNENLVYLSPWDLEIYFTCRKVLRRGTFRLYFPSKRIFIALKNPSPRPCSNPQPLGQVASTLTTTPPRRLSSGRLGRIVGLVGCVIYTENIKDNLVAVLKHHAFKTYGGVVVSFSHYLLHIGL